MNLRSSTFSASRWTSLSTVMATGLQMLQTIILARILVPEDFGLMAVATASISVLLLVVDLGLSQAIIHFDDIPHRHRSSLYWLNMLLACVLMLALAGASPIFGIWFQSDALASVLLWVAVVFPIKASGQQLRAMAERELQFNVLAINDITAALLGLTSAIIAALFGMGVYALVVGLLVKAITDSAMDWLRLPKHFRPSWHFNAKETKPYLAYGLYLVGESLLNTVRRNADVFIGGLVVGPGAIGFYSVPRNLSLRGAMVINSIVTRVGFPVMSRIKHDKQRLKHVYLQTLHMTASINFPVYAALGLFASTIIALLYGAQWQESACYLQVLAAWGLLRSAGNPVGSLLNACGKTRRAFWWNVVLLFVFPVALWYGAATGGLMGLAVAILLLQTGVFLPAWYFLVRPSCGATLSEYLLQFASPLFCTLVAGVAAILASILLTSGVLQLIVGLVAGGIIYLIMSWFFNRQWFLAMLELFGIRR